MTSIDVKVQVSITEPRGLRQYWTRFTRNKSAVVGLVVIIVITLASIIGPFFTADPNLAHPTEAFQPPSLEYLLGTDNLGRDQLARVLVGGRISLFVAVTGTVAAIVPGMILGMSAGYFGGWYDEVVSRVFDVALTFPTLLLAIVIVAAVGPSLTSIIIAIGLAGVPNYGRMFRALALEARNRDYVVAARALGYRTPRIIYRHVLPNVALPIIILAAGNMGRVAVAESSLSYLGAGIQPPTASWGNMIAAGQTYLQFAPWIPLVPGIALSLLTIAFAYFGDGLRDASDLRAVGSAS